MKVFWDTLVDLVTIPVKLGVMVFPFNLLQLIITFLLPLIVAAVLLRLLRLGLRAILDKSRINDLVIHRIYRGAKILGRLLFLGIFAILFSRLFGAEIGRYVRLFFSFLAVPLIEAGGTKITLVTIIMTLPIFYLASWLGKMAKSFVNQAFLDNFNLDESKRFSMTTLTRYGVMVLTIMIGLSIIGIDLSSLAVLFGVLGIGLGFGLQGMVANFFAGVIIIFTQPIKENDRIVVNELEGTVVQIRLLSTVVSTLTHEIIIIPNSKLVDNIIHNYSYDDRQIVISNQVQVAYESDLHQVMEVLQGIGEENPFTLPHSEVLVRVVSFDDSGITMKLIVWIQDVSKKYEALTWNNLGIWERFKENGISIPFPQMDVHLKEGPPPRGRGKTVRL
jgi:small-conductance mechanosensitive channel